jgi:hypothetical protein
MRNVPSTVCSPLQTNLNSKAHTHTTIRFPLSDKSVNYVLALQLLLSSPPSSIVASVIGIAMGLAYRWKALGLRKVASCYPLHHSSQTLNLQPLTLTHESPHYPSPQSAPNLRLSAPKP